jgi:serine/threonine protein phosphatase PrpC
MSSVALSCPACGAMAEPEDRYCEACGRSLGAPAPTLPDDDPQHVEADLGVAAGVSDRGRHHRRNEDAFRLECVADTVVAVVCDGVSTSTAPELASQRAVDAAARVLVAGIEGEHRSATAVTTEAVGAAAESVRALPWSPVTDMGPPSCTLISAICSGGTLTIGAVGDSRAYWLDEQAAHVLTVDDSWAQEQAAAGAVTEEQALSDPRAHSITRWIGRDAPPGPPEVVSWKPEVPGRLILCSDGLWNYASSPEEFARLARERAGGSALQLARRFTEYALESGGHDNITVVVIDVVPPR